MSDFRVRAWDLRVPLAAAALMRLGLTIAAFLRTGTEIITQGDTASYLEPGRNLFLHGVFATGGLPELDRTPGYPIFAMLSGMVFGNVLLAVCAQVAVSLGSLLLVSRIGELAFPGTRAGVAAAWLFAFEPVSVVYCARLMPETLFVFLLLLAVERLMTFQEEGRLKPVAIAGVWLGAATFVRPVSYYLIFALALGLAVTSRRRLGDWWKAPAILLVVAFPPILAWQARNRIETGYSGFSSIVETNLYFFQSAEVTAELKGISLKAQQILLGYGDDGTYAAAHPEQSEWSRADRLAFMRSQSKAILMQHPWLYLRTHMTGLGVVIFTPCASEWLQLLGEYPEKSTMPRRVINEGIVGSVKRIVENHPGMAAVMVLLEVDLLALYCLAAFGIFRKGGVSVAILMLAGIAVYFLAISGGAQAVGRYRLPAMPEVCVLAAGGVMKIRSEFLRRRLDGMKLR